MEFGANFNQSENSSTKGLIKNGFNFDTPISTPSSILKEAMLRVLEQTLNFESLNLGGNRIFFGAVCSP